MKDLKESINLSEAREVEYRVAFLGTHDQDNAPYSVTILVPKERQRDFEEYLEEEQDNTIMHCTGGQIEY